MIVCWFMLIGLLSSFLWNEGDSYSMTYRTEWLDVLKVVGKIIVVTFPKWWWKNGDPRALWQSHTSSSSDSITSKSPWVTLRCNLCNLCRNLCRNQMGRSAIEAAVPKRSHVANHCFPSVSRHKLPHMAGQVVLHKHCVPLEILVSQGQFENLGKCAKTHFSLLLLYVRSGRSTPIISHIIGDGHQPNNRVLYTNYNKDSY